MLIASVQWMILSSGDLGDDTVVGGLINGRIRAEAAKGLNKGTLTWHGMTTTREQGRLGGRKAAEERMATVALKWGKTVFAGVLPYPI